MSDENHKKLLSVCMCGRDDDYMLDFSYRAATTMNQLASYLADLGREDEVEVVFTDWGSEIPLAKNLQLSSAAGELCRFVYLSPETVALSQNGSRSFHTARAINTAIRRSTGQYVLVSNPDQLVTRTGLDALLRMLSGELAVPVDVANSLMLVPRIQVPWQFVQRQPDLKEWEQYLFFNEFALPRESIALQHCAGASGGLMMLGNHCRVLRGLDERHSGWGWSDIDFGMRALQSHPVFWLSAIGMSMFHMGHASSGRRREGLVAPNEPLWSVTPQVNNEDWGMKEFSPEEMRCTAIEKTVQASSVDGRNARPLGSADLITLENLLKGLRVEGVRDIVVRLISKGWTIPSGRLPAMMLAAWYSFDRLPRRCLLFAVGEGLIAHLVASACPNIEIYGIDRWQGIVEGNPAVRLAYDFVEVGHQGKVHYINGEPSTAVGRLMQAYGDKFSVDLIVLAEASSGSAWLPLLPSVLASGGAIIVSERSPDELEAVWLNIFRDRSELSTILVTCDQGRTGLIVCWPDRPGVQSVRRKESIEFDGQWVDQLLEERARERRFFRRVIHKFFG